MIEMSKNLDESFESLFTIRVEIEIHASLDVQPAAQLPEPIAVC